MNQRNQAIARENASIQSNVATIEANKANKKNALQQMAARLNVDASKLMSTLKATAFSKANDEEFAALIIVANEYNLNPLLKEIYAFPARGGIMPMIGYDGWLAIANRHPEFDGYEHNEIYDGDTFIGVESIFHRKDRAFPIKKAVYLEEFKMPTDPWKQKPRHMCQMRSFCQGARIAFGVTGIFIEGVDDAEQDLAPMKHAAVPTARQLQQQAQQQQREQEAYDQETGEILDDPEADAAAEREADRMLNGDQDDGYSESDVVIDAGEPSWKIHYRDTLENIMVAKTVKELADVEKEFVNHRATYEDDAVIVVERELKNARKRLSQ